MTARYKYRGTTHTVRDTNYWKRLNGVWRGLWQPETYRAYKEHRCPPPQAARTDADLADTRCAELQRE